MTQLDLSFRQHGRIGVMLPGSSGTLDQQLIVSGDEFEEHIKIGTASLDRFLVGGVLYERAESTEWTSGPASDLLAKYPRTPWTTVTPNNLMFVAPYPLDDRGLLFTITGPIEFELPSVPGLSGKAVMTDLDLVLLPSGIPLRATYVATARVSNAAGAEAEVVITAILEYFAVGETFTIEAPKLG